MKKRLSLKPLALLCTKITLLLILVIWTIWSNIALMVSTITVSNSRIPSGFSGFKIAQISDFHNSEIGENNYKLLKMLSDTEPNIIAITGDLVDSRHTNIDIALDFVKEAVKIAPVYYVPGNHEAYLSQYGKLKTSLKLEGVIVLEDESLQLEHNGEKITLIGLADPNFSINSGNTSEKNSDMVSNKLKNLNDVENRYTILLSHRPELFETYVNCNIDLVLSGHAHGGQFRLPFIGGVFAPNQGLFPKYDSGLYTDGDTNMVVSRGIGNSDMPVRFNNRPEIVLVKLISK